MLSALLVAAALAFTERDAAFAFTCASNLVIRHPARDAGTRGGSQAADWIFTTAKRAGADIRRDAFTAPVRLKDGSIVERNFINLYARFRTTPDAPMVILVAHYDTKPGAHCPGANDGASTTGLLMAMTTAIVQRGYAGAADLLIAWLDGEECITSYGPHDGFWGSKRAAEVLQDREADIRAVICLDMLGDRKLAITIPSNGSPKLMQHAKRAAQRTGVPVSLIAETVKDDHVAFLEAGYPAIDLIDFDYGSAAGKNDWWHTPHDTLDKLSRESLLKSGRLVAELVNTLVQ